MPQPILATDNLTVRFGDFFAVKNLNFSIEAGESLALIGPNGSGKTVLLKALLGLIPYEGKITWNSGVRVGYVPQKIDADRHLPINFRNLLEAKAAILKLDKREVVSAAEDAGLTKTILETSVGHLSGGQFQKSLIAFAILGKPNVLLLDEPTASIDIHGEEQIFDLIHRLQDSRKMTTIVVSHDLHFVYRYASKVLCLNKSAVCFGAPEEALRPESLSDLFGPHKFFHHFNGRQ